MGRRAPRPRARRTRRRGGAGGERGAGARVSPPPRRATAQGGGGVRVVVHPLCGAAQARAAARALCPRQAGDRPSRWGGRWSSVRLSPSPGFPHSPSGATAGGLRLALADRPRIKLSGPRGRRGDYAESGWPRRARCGLGLHPPGPPFMFVMVSQRPPGPRELGEAGERRHNGVGLPAVSHGLLPLPRPCRPPTQARPGQRPPGATAEPGKSPGRDASGPRTRLSQGERRSQGRREAQRKNPALWGADLP